MLGFLIPILKSLAQASEEAALCMSSCHLPIIHYQKETTRKKLKLRCFRELEFSIFYEKNYWKNTIQNDHKNNLFFLQLALISPSLSARTTPSGGPRSDAVHEAAAF